MLTSNLIDLIEYDEYQWSPMAVMRHLIMSKFIDVKYPQF